MNFLLLMCLSGLLSAQETSAPKVTTKGCEKLIPYIQEDFDLRQKNKRDSNVYATVLNYLEATFKDRTNYLDHYEKIDYIGDKKFFDSAYNKIYYKVKFEKIKTLSACTINYNSNKKEWDISPVDKERVKVITDNPSTSGLTDNDSVYIEYADIKVGSYIVLISDIEMNRVETLPEGRSFYFVPKYDSGDARYYNRKYKIILPENIKPHVKIHDNRKSGIKNYDFKSYKKGNSTVYEFESKKSSYLEEEKFMNLDNGFIPYNYISTYESWNSLNEFFYGTYNKKISDAKTLLEVEVHKIAKFFNVEKKDLNASHMYYYVRDNFRYVYAHTGEGSSVPHDIHVILRERSGDCKDKTLLLVALLRTIGLEAFPMKLRSNNTYNYDLDYPSLNFDHAIVGYKDKKENKMFFLDTTSTYLPFPYTPSGDSDRAYFMITKEGVVRSKTPPINGNIRYFTKTIELDNNGNGVSDINVKLYGVSQAEESKPFRTVKDQQLKYAEEFVNGNSVEIKDLKLINLLNYKEPLEIKIRAKSRDVGEKINDLIVLPRAIHFKRNNLGTKPRKTPMVWESSHLDFNSSYTYIIPRGYKVRNIPSDFEYEDKYMKTSVSYKKDGENKIIEIVRTSYKEAVIQPNDFQKEKENLNKVFDYQKQRIVLEKDLSV